MYRCTYCEAIVTSDVSTLCIYCAERCCKKDCIDLHYEEWHDKDEPYDPDEPEDRRLLVSKSMAAKLRHEGFGDLIRTVRPI